MTKEILTDLVLNGLEKGIVKLIQSQNDGEVVASIGSKNNWFYFAGSEGADYTVDEFEKRYTKKKIAEQIATVIFNEHTYDPLDPEWLGYYYMLSAASEDCLFFQ